MAHVQSKMGGVCLTKGLFYLSWSISPRSSFCLVSRTATYVTRMRGCVGGALSDGRPYPDISLVGSFVVILKLGVFNQLIEDNLA